MRLEQKITMKALGWSRGKIELEIGKVPRDGGRVLLGRVAGIIVGTKATKDVNDDVIFGLKGNFRAISSITGEEISSGIAYLPSGIQGMLETALADTRSETKDPNATVQFVVDVYAIPANNKVGYSFNADTVSKEDAKDPVADLLNVASETAALPAPTEPKAEEKPAKEKEAK